MPERQTRNPNRTMDYTRSQYGADRFRTSNSSSDYEREVEDSRRTRQVDAQFPNSAESSETFLDDYREHQGRRLSGRQDDRYVGRDQDYDFYKADAFDVHYKPHAEEGFFQRLKSHFGKGPKGYKRSDERIYEDVCETLYHHPSIDASEIEVTVKDGIVTLTGTVENRRTKRWAEDAIESCRGVTDVHNRLQARNLNLKNLY